MKKSLRIISAVVVVSSLGISGCENMTAGENALIGGGLAGAATGIALGASGVPVGVALPVSLGAAAAGGALGYGVSKAQVNRDQRRFAEQRGQMLVAEAQEKGVRNIPRYILVDTVGERAREGRPVMMFDTTTGRVASNRVYYINQSPNRNGFVEASPSMLSAR